MFCTPKSNIFPLVFPLIQKSNAFIKRWSDWLRGAAIAAGISSLAACAQTNVVTVQTQNGDTSFKVEIADTPAARQEGLMFRDRLAPDAGMLFDFKKEQQVAFWMQNTLIPLDMIFIGADGVVRNVHVNARPMDTTAIPSKGPVRYVLEIAGGRSSEIGLVAGDKVTGPPMGSTSP